MTQVLLIHKLRLNNLLAIGVDKSQPYKLE